MVNKSYFCYIFCILVYKYLLLARRDLNENDHQQRSLMTVNSDTQLQLGDLP